MNISIDYHAHNNKLSDYNPQFKILLGILTLIICLISQKPFIPFLISLIMSSIIIFKAHIPWRFYLKFIGAPLGFGVLTLFFMAFFFGTQPLFATSIGDLTIYQDGLNLGLLVFSRMVGSFACLGFLTLTTPLNDIFSQLHKLKVPDIFIELALLMYRSIFIFIDESDRMYHAQQTRLGYNGLKNSYHSLGLLASNLFIKSWFKGEKVHLAMESRCYQGELRSMNKYSSLTLKHVLVLIFFEFSLILGLYLTSGLKLI